MTARPEESVTTDSVTIAQRKFSVLREPLLPAVALDAATEDGRFTATVAITLEAYVSGRARPIALDRYLARLLVVGSSIYDVRHSVIGMDPDEDLIYISASIDMRQMHADSPGQFAA